MGKNVINTEEFEEIKQIMDHGKELHRKRAAELEEMRRKRQAQEEETMRKLQLAKIEERQLWEKTINTTRKKIHKSFLTIFICITLLVVLIATTLPTNVLMAGLYVERGEIEYIGTQYGWHDDSLKKAWDENVAVLNETISNSWYASLFAKSPIIVDFLIIVGEIAVTALLVWIIYIKCKSIQIYWEKLKEKGCLRHR